MQGILIALWFQQNESWSSDIKLYSQSAVIFSNIVVQLSAFTRCSWNFLGIFWQLWVHRRTLSGIFRFCRQNFLRNFWSLSRRSPWPLRGVSIVQLWCHDEISHVLGKSRGCEEVRERTCSFHLQKIKNLLVSNVVHNFCIFFQFSWLNTTFCSCFYWNKWSKIIMFKTSWFVHRKFM